MADLKQYILSNAIDHVYIAFFYSDFIQQMQASPEEYSSVALWPP